MLGIDSLAIASLALSSSLSLNIGTINEADGVVDRSFWVRNDSQQTVTLVQGYTSCGCTTIDFSKDEPLASGDSTLVSLHFNPRGKSGEFYESGTVVHYLDGKRMFTQMALEGECITSEETLMTQYPIILTEHLRQSRNRFDVGYMSPGQSKTLYTTILHRDENNRRELIPIEFKVDADTPKGLQHIPLELTTQSQGNPVCVIITIDVYVK